MSLVQETSKPAAQEVTWDDQKKINEFSTLTQRKDMLTEELKRLQQEKEYLDDVISEIELLELEDDDDDLNSDDDEDNDDVDALAKQGEFKDKAGKIQYKIGDSLIFMSYEEAGERAKEDGEKIDALIEEQQRDLDAIEETLSKLKTQLYAKFGDSINLERD